MTSYRTLRWTYFLGGRPRRGEPEAMVVDRTCVPVEQGAERTPAAGRRTGPQVPVGGVVGRHVLVVCTRSGGVAVYRNENSPPGSAWGRGPKMRRSDSAMRTSLMLASRRAISPLSANSHSSLP